jgi:hypothetical protein
VQANPQFLRAVRTPLWRKSIPVSDVLFPPKFLKPHGAALLPPALPVSESMVCRRIEAEHCVKTNPKRPPKDYMDTWDFDWDGKA